MEFFAYCATCEKEIDRNENEKKLVSASLNHQLENPDHIVEMGIVRENKTQG